MWILIFNLLLFLSGAYIFVALGLCSALVLILYFNIPMHNLGGMILGRVSSYPLLAMPLFMLAGNLLLYSGGIGRFIDFFKAWLGHFTGGLLITTIAFCMFFAAMTGSGIATIAAVGSIMIPEMKKAGYSAGLRSGVVGASGQLGNLIPPSISLIVIGALLERSVATFFAAALIPGVTIGLGSIIVGTIIAKKQGVVPSRPVSWGSRWRTSVKAIPCIIMPLLILGGIYSGQFTPTEAAAIACFYVILLGVFVYGGLRSWQGWKNSFLTAARNAVLIYIIMASVKMFSLVISLSGIAVTMTRLIIGFGLGTLGFVLVWNVILLGLGFFINPITVFYMTFPILLPLCEELQINLIWLGVLWQMNALIGAATPPMAGGLYLTSRVANVPPEEVFKGILPFLGVWVTVMFLVIFVPEVTLWLPKVMGMRLLR